jgi:hypothetical protein
MSAHTSPSAVFNAAANNAEAARQAAVVPGASQATVIAAELTYFRACRTAAIANGISPAPFNNAIKSLGSIT